MATVRKLPNGKYQLNYMNSTGKRARRNFRSWREANAAKIDIEGKIAKGVDRPQGDQMRVGDLLDSYLAHVTAREGRGELSRKHVAVVSGHTANWLKSETYGIAHHKLQHLSTGLVAGFRDDLRNKTDLSYVTIRKVLGTLHGAIEFGRERDLISHNPAHGLKIETKRSEKPKEIVPPSKEDVVAVLAATHGPALVKDNSRERERKRKEHLTRVAITLAAVSALRASEQWALRWKEVNFNGGAISVVRRVDTYRIEDVPKSKAGFRDIPISDLLISDLKAWRLRSGFSNQSDLVFTNKKGGFVGHDNFVKRQFKPCLEIADVEAFNWHALRHFAISTWIENGMDLKEVSTLAGHSSIQITADRYGHLFKKESRRENMNDIADEIFG